MGIGGAVLYSVAYMAVRGLVGLVALAARVFRWLGRAFLDGAALHGASLGGGQWFHDPLWSNVPQVKDLWHHDVGALGD